MNKYSKVLYFLLAFGFPLAAYPIGPSIGPIIFEGAGAAAGTWESMGGFRMNPIAISAAVLVGASVVAYRMSDGHGGGVDFFSGKSVAVPPPPGWTNANNPPGSVQPQVTTTYTISNSCGSYTGPSSAAACSYAAKFIAGTSSDCDQVSSNFDGEVCHWTYIPNGNHGLAAMPGYTSMTCLSGYTLNGSNCILAESPGNLAQWPSDGVPSYMQDNTGNWNLLPRDPDILSSNGISINGDTASRSGNDLHGNPVQESVTATGDGGVDYQRKSQTIEPSTGMPKTITDSLHTDSSGTVTASTTASTVPTDVVAGTTNLPDMGAQISQAMNSLSMAIGTGFTGLTSSIYNAASSSASSVVSALGAVQSGISGLSSTMVSGLSVVQAGIQNAVAASSTAITAGLTSAQTVIQSAIQTATLATTQAITDGKQALTDTVTSAANNIKSSVEAVRQSVPIAQEAITQAVGNAADRTHDAVVENTQAVAAEQAAITKALDGIAKETTLEKVEQDIRALAPPDDYPTVPPLDVPTYEPVAGYESATVPPGGPDEENARAQLSASWDNFYNKTSAKASPYSHYVRGFFPSGGGGGGDCPPPIEFDLPAISPLMGVNNHVSIPIDCRIIVIIGDCILMFSSVVAWQIATGRGNA